MKRPAWLLLATLGLVLAPVQPMGAGPAKLPAAEMKCCAPQGSCGDQHSASCPGQPKRECPACPLSCVNGCLAVLSNAEPPAAPLLLVARLDSPVEKGLQRADPPQLPPPR